MITLRRRFVTARSAIVALAVGVLSVTSLATANAASQSATATARASVPVTRSSPAPASDGDTKCVPWPKPTSPGLKCTGTYSGSTAWNPWTWHAISQQPVVTVSQAKDLTDQGVQVTWSDFTPSLDYSNGTYTPNPTSTNPLYQVSIFECEGTNPILDSSTGFDGSECYLPPVGSSPEQETNGPANGLLENTLDTSSPPKTDSCPSTSQAPDPTSVFCDYTTLPYKPKWDGGNPATWTGQADFHVEAPTTRSQGGFFNCGPSTPCSLVIVPNWGGTPVWKTNQYGGAFSWTDTSLCDQHWLGSGEDPTPSEYKKDPDLLGDPNPNPNSTNYSLEQGDFESGYGGDEPGSSPYAQISSAENTPPSIGGGSYACWAADRIVVPLSFAPTPKDCPNNASAFYAQGSPMMETQMLQWQAGWCNGPAPVTLSYTSNSESLAREDFLAGAQIGGASTDMALVTLPVTAAEQQASHRQFTYAPLANSGTGIAYLVDDPQTGSQITRMVLNPRLLAKLTTQSYTLQYTSECGSPPTPGVYCDPAVTRNPYSLFDDPEFLSLNKQCQPYGQPASYVCSNPSRGTNPGARDDFPADNQTAPSNDVNYGGFLPTVLEANNDMTYDLTGWIAADPDASAFLAGTTDPWGMHVNNNYLHVAYPTQAFSELDNGVTIKLPPCPAGGICQPAADESMQASWNFQINLETIATDLLTDQATADQNMDSCSLGSATSCTQIGQMNPTTAAPTELIGSRALLSVLDLGDIAGYQFPAAELVNGAGDAVGPSQASVEAAVSDMKTNPDGITQYFDYTSTDPAAYPLAMVDYAMVPTCGLSHPEASAIADFLTKVATTGQTQGEAPGDLAPGYYPLTAKQKTQTLQAARDVEKQTCTSPPPDHTVDGSQPGTTGASRKTPAGGQPSPSASPSSIGKARTAAFGQKSPYSGVAGLLVLLAIVIGVLLVVGGPTAWVITVTGRWPVVLRGVRTIRARLRTGLGRLAGLVIRRA
jgi:hypothetical protein